MDPEMLYTMWLKNKLLKPEEIEYLKSIEGDEELINELFGSDLSFGTGGMRGVMGVGTSKINGYQIARAAQAFSNDLIRKAKGRVGNGVAIAFDTRNCSAEFAEDAARVLLGNGIGTALFLKPTSVPQLSFAIRYLGLEGGIMITASHNPKEYNGFKIYNKTGCQMTPEEAKTVTDEFMKIQMPSQIHKYVGYLRLNSIHKKIGPSNDLKFADAVMKAKITDDFDPEVGIVYSPLHGTGAVPVPYVFKERGFKNFWTVKEQMEGDGEFPTVDQPNPEDHKGLKMAIDLAKEKNADIVIATDPDCDRVGLGVKDKDGEFIALTGNQQGALLLDYIINFKKDMPENPVMVQTVVTSSFAKDIAVKAGIAVKETLVGFKYIGEYMNLCEENGEKNYIFGFEESYGSLAGTHARDKDGVSTAMVMGEMAGVYKKQGYTILDRLDALYKEFGYYDDEGKSFFFHGVSGMEKMGEIMQKVRDEKISELGGEAVVQTDFLNDETGLPKENIVRLDFSDGSFMAVRPSGTEPKLKLYFSVKGKTKEEAAERKTRIVEDFLPYID